MTSVVGIDIGSFSCYLSVARKGGLETLLNDYSDRCTLSCVSFSKKGRLIGNAAHMQLTTNPKNTIKNFIPLIGKKFGDNFLQMELPYLNYKVVEDQESIAVEVQYFSQTYKFKPEQLMAMLLTKLKLLAESELQMPINQIVINVPSFYTVSERLCVKTALNIAGIECLRIINDLTAVALFYHVTRFQSLNQPKVVAFVDVGYTNFQAAIVRFQKDHFQILQETFEWNLGGREFDRVIFKYLMKVFKEKYSIDVLDSTKASLRLMSEAERVKKRLSANTAEFEVQIECLMNELDVSAKIDRSLFENLCDGLFRRMRSSLETLIKEYQKKYGREQITCVEIVGGSTRVPALKQIIGECFHMEPQFTLNAEEAVSRGCAIQSAMLNSNCIIRRVDYTNYVPYGITLESYNGSDALLSMQPEKRAAHRIESVNIVEPGQQFPLVNGTVELNASGCNLMEIRYTDRNMVPNDNKVIGYIRINPESCQQDRFCKLLLEFSIDASGLFSINSLNLKRNSKSPRSTNDVTVPTIPNNMSSPSDSATKFDRKKMANSNSKTHKSASTSDVYGPVDFQIRYLMNADQNGLTKMIQQEVEFVNKDKEEQDRLNYKNRLEENIYKYRSRINEYCTDNARQKEMESTLNYINNMENWLFEEGEDETKQCYMDNIKKLDKAIDPFLMKKGAKYNFNESNCEEVLLQLIKTAEEVKQRSSSTSQSASLPVADGVSNNCSPSAVSNNHQKQHKELEKIQYFINQGKEVLNNFKEYLTNGKELENFVNEFQSQLDRLCDISELDINSQQQNL